MSKKLTISIIILFLLLLGIFLIFNNNESNQDEGEIATETHEEKKEREMQEALARYEQFESESKGNFEDFFEFADTEGWETFDAGAYTYMLPEGWCDGGRDTCGGKAEKWRAFDAVFVSNFSLSDGYSDSSQNVKNLTTMNYEIYHLEEDILVMREVWNLGENKYNSATSYTVLLPMLNFATSVFLSAKEEQYYGNEQHYENILNSVVRSIKVKE